MDGENRGYWAEDEDKYYLRRTYIDEVEVVR